LLLVLWFFGVMVLWYGSSAFRTRANKFAPPFILQLLAISRYPFGAGILIAVARGIVALWCYGIMARGNALSTRANKLDLPFYPP
jgi:hypothetical protein